MIPTVLLIEDNEQNRYLATYLLESQGWRVESAADGSAGIRRAKELVPDLILLDIQLPRMDGYEVARALRAESLLVSVPIVAITSYAMAGDCEKALAAGCNGYIEKPIQPETLIADLSRFLQGRLVRNA